MYLLISNNTLSYHGPPKEGECLKRTPPESQEKGDNVGFTLKNSFEE